MRILFLTQLLPLPLDAGPKVRSYHVLRYLAQAGHDVHLVSFIRPGEDAKVVEPLRQMCRSIDLVPLVRSRARDVRDGVRSLFSSMPFLVLRDQVEPMRQQLTRLVDERSFDAVHADQLWMAPYVTNGVKVGLRVLDQHNAVYLVPQRMAEHHANPVVRALLRKEASKLAAFERDTCRRFDRVVWVTDEDRRAVVAPTDERAGRDVVIPIATDPDMRPRLRRVRPFRVTFLGGLHWPPNSEGVAWFVATVWPRVAAAVPSAVLTIIGRQGVKALPGLQGAERVEITGYVDDPLPYLTETGAFVVPLRSGAGMRVKILDAWCWGLPMVSTTVGAEGLEAVHGENLLIADDADAFAEGVIRIMQDEVMAGHLAEHGRATVETTYDWKTIYRAWDAVYRK